MRRREKDTVEAALSILVDTVQYGLRGQEHCERWGRAWMSGGMSFPPLRAARARACAAKGALEEGPALRYREPNVQCLARGEAGQQQQQQQQQQEQQKVGRWRRKRKKRAQRGKRRRTALESRANLQFSRPIAPPKMNRDVITENEDEDGARMGARTRTRKRSRKELRHVR